MQQLFQLFSLPQDLLASQTTAISFLKPIQDQCIRRQQSQNPFLAKGTTEVVSRLDSNSVRVPAHAELITVMHFKQHNYFDPG